MLYMHAGAGGFVKLTRKPTSHPSTDIISSSESLLLESDASSTHVNALQTPDKDAVRYHILPLLPWLEVDGVLFLGTCN